MSKEVDKILSLYGKLTDEQLIEFNRRFFDKNNDLETFMKETRFASGQCCPFCGSAAASRNGKRWSG